MTKLILCHMSISPPSRFALITAQHLALDIDIRNVDLFSGEGHTAEYKAINPTSTVPALVDGNVKIFESSAIAIYLVEKFEKDDSHSLYPKNLELRTTVNARLFYIASYIFPRLYQIFVSGYFGKEIEIPQEKIDEVMRGYQTIETFLEGNEYLAGETLTLADLSLWPQMEFLGQLISVEKEKFPNFDRWWTKMREHPSFAMNKKGADDHIALYHQGVEKAKEGCPFKRFVA